MPELPEVETTRRGVEPYLSGQRICRLEVREGRLRWPVPERLGTLLLDARVRAVQRRGKYLLLRFDAGTLLIHLGMSGSLRVLTSPTPPPRKHDHIDIVMANGHLLRYHDPRRFGAFLWIEGEPQRHPLLADLGPEPLEGGFDGRWLYRLSRGRKVSVKQFLMDGHVVAGVGNIYANEALFEAGIDPRRQAGRIGYARYERLAAAVRRILGSAIAKGGTTLRDYVNGDGTPGYFALSLNVYGRAGQPCPGCGAAVRVARNAQRSTFYCPHCQL